MEAGIAYAQNSASNYVYFAFISYKSEDSKWALWLKKQLQSYRLPLATHHNHRDKPIRCNPIFLDKTNLTPGALDTGLRAEVQASKYIIVICSRNARSNPKYLDDELRYFIEGTGSPDRVIPFIVEPDGPFKASCFPPRLEALCAEHDIETVDAAALGKRRAVLQTLSIMLDIRREELERDDGRRRRLHRMVTGLLAVLLAASCVWLWDFNRLKTEYYLDYSEIYGVPRGIGRLNEEDLPGMHRYYAFQHSQALVRQVTCVQAPGEIGIDAYFTTNGPSEHGYFEDAIPDSAYACLIPEARPQLSRYTYNADRSLQMVEYVDSATDEVLLRKKYLNPRVVNLEQYKSNNLTVSALIVRLLLEYDDNGFLVETRYVDDVRLNHAYTDDSGAAGILCDRDALGRPIGLWYLSSAGGNAEFGQTYSLTANKNGICGWQYAYSEAGDMVFVQCVGPDASPVTCPEGYCALTMEYDRRHNLTRIDHLATDGTPCTLAQGYACMVLDYDAAGEIEAHRFLEANGNPVALNTGGYFGYRDTYNANDIIGTNKLERRAYFDADGAPMTTAWGFHAYTRGTEIVEAGDEKNLVATIAFFDIDGAPVVCREGYARTKNVYDERLLLLEKSYYGIDGEPVCDYRGIAALSQEYDHWGALIRRRNFGPDGRPTLVTNESENGSIAGYSVWALRYNAQGLVEFESFFDIDETPVLCDCRFFQRRNEYNAQGSLIGQRYFGSDYAPIRGLDGTARYEKVWDRAQSAYLTRNYDERDNLLNRKCVAGFFQSSPTEDKDLYHACILVGLEDWVYECGTTAAEARQTIDGFSRAILSIEGSTRVFYVQYNPEVERFELYHSEFERGKMGMRILEYAISDSEYALILDAMQEEATYKRLPHKWGGEDAQ